MHHSPSWPQAPRPAPLPLPNSYNSNSSGSHSSHGAMSSSDVAWEKDNWTTFTVWDIDRAFQEAQDAYALIQQRSRKKRTMLQACFGIKGADEDELGRSLGLGRQVKEIMELGRDTIGSKFEKGDSTCHAILSAQLLRTQQEIHVPILDYSLARSPTPLFLPDFLSISLITAAKAIRRSVLQALRDQFARMHHSHASAITPFLPLPKFSVNFCPLALQLQKESGGVGGNRASLRASKRLSPSFNFPTQKFRPHDRYDEREICPSCEACVSVSTHSGLPASRRWLFQCHLRQESGGKNHETGARFACTACYKKFDDSYGFLDHVFQREIGSERSCQRRWSSCGDLNKMFVEYGSDAFIDKEKERESKYLGHSPGLSSWRSESEGKSGSDITEWEVDCNGSEKSSGSEEEWGKLSKEWSDGYKRFDTYGRYSGCRPNMMTMNRTRSIR